jgi:hypothetical protein
VTTDRKGCFRLTGIGRDRLVWLLLEGPTLASQKLTVRTRAGKPLEVTESKGRPDYRDGAHLLRGRLPARGGADQADRRRRL